MWHSVHRHGDDLCISNKGYATKEEALEKGKGSAANPLVGAINSDWFKDAKRRTNAQDALS